MEKSTRLNHPPEVAVPADNRPVVAPIYQTVKFEFDTVAETVRYQRRERPGFYYLRTSNPTTRQLELTLAELQGRAECIVCASGVAAINGALFALTRQGDHVLCFIESYGPTRQFIRGNLARFGVRHTLLSIEDLAGIGQVLASTPTRLVIFESPTNPVSKIADLAAISALARRHGALTLLDNTFAGPHQHGQFDIDLYLHSLTKFAAGHGDVMGGAVIGSAELIGLMRPEFTLLGGVLDPHAAFLAQRGLKTYFVRYREQSRSAQRIAEFLLNHPAILRVQYPGLASHPRHELARSQMSEFGSVLSFELRGGAEAGRHFAEALQLFAMAASLGATDSLVLPPQLIGVRDLNAEQLQLSGIGPATVRLSIGLEDTADLLADLAQALAAAA
ncbi:MAG TPA: aminotransferase class I/II-fold pyridoxal phosphate-dependent enzyme [Steroidobacteraceae bacterium]|nr:aminotransferase class I/II-fold pyridoxal phosphate-dependent enzyme [Steroidobacteraceae bacterium]